MNRVHLNEGWEHVRQPLGGVWEVWRYGSQLPWISVTLPHCFNARDAVDPDVTYYQGEGWYRRLLDQSNPYPNGRTLLHFEGAGQKADVYVYTRLVGSHTGGYDEFTIDLTDAVADFSQGDVAGCFDGVPLAVRCDNSRDLEMIPSDLSDFNLYGGLYRAVYLEHAPAVSLERVLVDSQIEDGRAEVTVNARLYNPLELQTPLELEVRIVDGDGKMVQAKALALSPWSGPQPLLSATIEQPELWSPRRPTLYRCEVTLRSPHGQQEIVERFGLRHFRFAQHGPFYLNGERLLLRGTHRHEDHAGVGAAMTEELVRREMALIKAMGANLLRLGHYQQSSLVLDLCDELGLLVWEEIPWCRGGLGGARYRQQARDMLEAMIDQHRNHPSVFVWGLGNENDWPGDFETFDQQEIRAFMNELNDLAHRLDPSRKTAIRRCDFCKDIVDVYSPSIWAGWYRGRYPEYQDISLREMQSVDHFLHVEWGADSHARRHSETPNKGLGQIDPGGVADERAGDFLPSGGTARASRDGEWTETYACDLFDWHLKEQEAMDWLTGTAQWVFKDFSTPLRPENPVPYVNQKGVVERDLTPKEAYYVFQSYWTKEPVVRIYGHTWQRRWGAKEEARWVKVYSNCSQVELFLNGESCGKRQRDSQDFPAAGLRWTVRFREGENRLRAVAQQDGSVVEDEVTLIYQTEEWSTPARMALDEIGRKGDAVKVQVRVEDEHGVLCLDARNVVRFGLVGDGRLLVDLGTSTGSRQVQLYNGRAEITVRLERGASVVSVSSNGMATQFLRLVAR